MPSEIERKFLVATDGWQEGVEGHGTEIVQGYLHAADDGSIRVRLSGDDDAVLTVKRGGREQVRREVEVSLGRSDARRLLEQAAVGDTIAKTRHRVALPAIGGHVHTAEVDVFHGPHDGLVLAEVELPDADAPVPDVGWLGEEVTGDARYYNARIALHGVPDREGGDC